MSDLLILMLLDYSMVTAMLVLAYLSKRLGDALKIPRYYYLFFATAIAVVFSCGIDIVAAVANVPTWGTVALTIRCGAGFVAFAVSLRYWKWLFTEFFGG